MSTTPRTDAVTLVVSQMQVLPEEVVSAEVAREFEREITELHQELANLREDN